MTADCRPETGLAPSRPTYRFTSTGNWQCVKTFCVSLPISKPRTPRMPCEAIMIRSQPLLVAVLMIAWYGWSLNAISVSQGTPSSSAAFFNAAIYVSAWATDGSGASQ